MRTRHRLILLSLMVLLVPFSARAQDPDDKEPSDKEPAQKEPEDKVPRLRRADLIRIAVKQLIKMQEAPGQWPYVDDERVFTGLPIGFRISGTSLVCQALMYAAPDDKEAQEAVQRGLAFVLKHLNHPALKPTIEYQYDFRVWGHSFALEFLCKIRDRKLCGKHEKKIAKWIPRLIDCLVKEEMPNGGWNYALLGGKNSGSHVTGPVVQALLWARSQGENVPDEIIDRARQALEAARANTGAFVYSGEAGEKEEPIPGATCRSVVCTTTLALLGAGSVDDVRSAIANFHEHWDELEKRRQKTGNHEGPYGIAPYYVFYGHRYAAQAIQILPKKERAQERKRLMKLFLKTRSADGTWNDRVFPRARYVCTAMVVLALLGDQAPLPPKLAKTK